METPSFEQFRVAQPQDICACGQTHACETEYIVVTDRISKMLGEFLKHLHVESVCAIFDETTLALAQDDGLLSGLRFREIVLRREGMLVPDERAVFEILSQVPKTADLLIAVGSGTINDLTKYCAHLLSLPYLCVATAPSMDGYVSGVSPLNVFDTKITYPAAPPNAVFAELSLLKNAPIDMISAGAGDILGKYTALADWKLANKLKGEYFCPVIAAMVQDALDQTVSAIPGLIARNSNSVQTLMHALTLSGTAISYAGNSRPASGAEHHLAHYFELLYLREKRAPVFHGVKVALGLLMVLSAYRFFAADAAVAEIAAQLPELSWVKNQMRTLRLPISPSEIGLSKEEVYQGLLHARELRDRFTIMDYAAEKGCLEQVAKTILEEID